MMSRLALFLLLVLGVAARVDGVRAASSTVTLQFSGPASTSVACTPNYASGQQSFPLPQAAGAVMATCTVQPSTWLGSLSLTGNSAFGMHGTQIVVGSGGYNIAGSVTLTITATP